MSPLAPAEIDPKAFQDKKTDELIAWALDEYNPDISLACSFGAEDVVMIDLLSKSGKPFRVFSLDTGRLNQETYDVMDRIRKRYDIEIEAFYPQRDRVEEMLRKKGPNSFYESIENRKECCGIRKVEPLNRAISELKAWMTGLRREQAVTRGELPKVENDVDRKVVKINPLVDWTSDDVWKHIKENDVPYNLLHDQKFPSIGCAPCTRAIEPGEDARAGRWWWEDPKSKECGLHVPGAKA